uniref:Location of vulva defective 1 n=1 Tax=Ascaris suum TaxID=6253 RepID=F1KR83_ASCSU
MSIIGGMIESNNVALNNPLSGDRDAALKYDIMNYDKLFLGIPLDRSSITYVDHLTADEWAFSAAQTQQKALNRQFINTANTLLSTIADELVRRQSANGLGAASVYKDSGAIGMNVEYGYASDIFANPLECKSWKIHFPPSLQLLNVQSIPDTQMIQSNFFCYDENPYQHIYNYKPLITSGAALSSLKIYDGDVIPVQNTLWPITLEATLQGWSDLPTEAYCTEFQDYQVLDIHSFVTTVWNGSLFIDFKKGSGSVEEGEIWIFVAFQRLPGPLPEDHDWRFLVGNQKVTNHFMIGSADMVNMTGRFFIGVGSTIPLHRYSNQSNVVVYTHNGSAPIYFAKKLPFDYTIRVLTKGCYYLADGSIGFSNYGETIGEYVGDEFVQCLSNHLTTFSVGLFNADIPDLFKYVYIENDQPRSAAILIIVATFSAFMAIVGWTAFHHDLQDISKGRIRYMMDNKYHADYKYLVAVETGYRMFATTDSRIHLNVIGDKAMELSRELCGDEDMGRQFRWGTTDRFLMTTVWSLGQLQKIRIWTDESGCGHRQSWYCNTITFKDLQTNEIFEFYVNDWFGSQTYDGKTQRVIPVATKREHSILRKAFSFHSIADHLTYWNMFTGGGMLTRLRFNRVERVLNVYLAMLLAMLINIIVVAHESYVEVNLTSLSILGYYFTWKDVALGFGFSWVCVPSSILIPYVHSFIPVMHKASERGEKFLRMSKHDFDGRLKWKHRFAHMFKYIEFVIAIAIAITIMHFAFIYYTEQTMAFSRRFLITVLFWIVFTEPLKAFICSLYCTITCKNHQLIRDYELPEISERIAETDDVPKREIVGEVEKKVVALRGVCTTRDRRMRDEQLFVTTREIVFVFVSVNICLGIAFISQDTAAYYYQVEMRNLLCAAPHQNFTQITTVAAFWSYMQTHFINAMRVSWYDGKPAWGMRGFMNDKVSRTMGYGILRQVRSVPNRNCGLVEKLAGYFNACEGYTRERFEDNTPAYSVGWKSAVDINDAQPQYIYYSQEALQGTTFYGTHDAYTGGGYVQTLNGSAEELHTAFTRLEKENWIDEGTRAVFIEFSAYNVQTNHFSVIQLALEMPPFGTVFPTASIQIVRLLNDADGRGSIVTLCEVLYTLLCIFLPLNELFMLFFDGPRKYLLSFWNYINLAIAAFAIASLVSYVYRQIGINEAVALFTATNGNSYIRLDRQRDLQLNFLAFLSIVVFFTCMKMINVLRFNRRIGLFTQTLSQSARTIVVFGAVFGIVSVAFDSALFIMLSPRLQSYSNLSSVAKSSIISLLGKLFATDIATVSHFGTAIYMVFMLAGKIVLLNLFVMMVMTEFEILRCDPKNQSNDYEALDHIGSKALKICKQYKRHHLPNLGFPDAYHTSLVCDRLDAKIELLAHSINAFCWHINFASNIRGDLMK